MYNKQDILASLGRETHLVKHLYSKATPEMMDYRFSDKQRSVRELLIYMTTMGSNIIMYMKDGKYDHAKAVAISEEQNAKGVENFPAMMDEQLDKMSVFINSLSEEDLNREFDLFGSWWQTCKSRILEVMLKNFPAYRMMLFLMLKGAGAHHLWTSNVWGGRDSN